MIRSIFLLSLVLVASSTADAGSNQSGLDRIVLQDANQTAIKQSDYPKTIIDSAGRAVTVDMPVGRIIVLSPDAAVAVTALGAQDKVVGIVDSIKARGDLFPLLKNKMSVGKFDDPNIDLVSAITILSISLDLYTLENGSTRISSMT